VTTRDILLVEDNTDDEVLTLRALKKNNIINKVNVARDGAEALALFFPDDGADVELPGLILLDLKLPKVDGMEVLRKIRADQRTRLIPVVVLTSSREQEDVIDSYQCGANGYVRKPVQFGEFSETVSALGVYWLLLNESPVEYILASD
jgi:CheY-like chemotaxis protein